MARRNRKTLKNFFQKGQMPTQENFSDLIDSMVNIVDEGFSKSINDGLEISSIGDSSKLISFFQNIEDKSPVWTIDIDKENSNLSFKNKNGDQELVLDKVGHVGIGTDNPVNTLDINGIVSYQGRIGTYKSGLIPADGQWHSIIAGLDGCHAFEIMAGVGKKKSGKYSLVHAHALNTFNSESRIYYHQSFFRTMCNTMKLRWTGSMHDYSLEMKTRSDYGADIYINYSVGQLWFDTYMDKCFKPKED
jgi:hypothetical protein